MAVPPDRTHLYILLDRSGSMEAMRDDVIGGFNRFLADQRADDPDTRVTLVQFDSRDPHDVLVGAQPVGEVPPLTRERFVPRGGTPLLDATGLLIARAAVRTEQLALAGDSPESIVLVTITDGQENQSREYDRPTILRLVKARQAEGWSFTFLGAGLDAYGEAGGMGYAVGSVQAFAADGTGVGAAFSSLTRATSAHRQRVRSGTVPRAGDFFAGVKEAEAERDHRAIR